MQGLDLFGFLALLAGLVFYGFEEKGSWAIIGFAVACTLGSVYGFLQGAWPFGIVEAIWALVALRRWMKVRTDDTKRG